MPRMFRRRARALTARRSSAPACPLTLLAENSGEAADRGTVNGADVRQWTRLTSTCRQRRFVPTT
ncbi:hypothetical protein [Streptomyces sp. NPDC058335]|uniref:hypothetical protein n=1 Tax=Streptomyces sp. NPDC058335 TaxID=3346451 RepID=UPI00364E9DB0